jgi:EAL domain-containing protein (putative c-di-GMP-specific phosphodiesterase class I)
VLETACRQLAVWARRTDRKHLTIAVNVSARQFHHAGFVDQVLSVLHETGANPQRLKLELTESLLITHVEEVVTKMGALKARGVCFSLDDFGTGYSSLAYLKRLPLDQLKIDKGFVSHVLTDTNDAAIARMIVALSESLGLEVIAEGVEHAEQRDFWRSMAATPTRATFSAAPCRWTPWRPTRMPRGWQPGPPEAPVAKRQASRAWWRAICARTWRAPCRPACCAR